jgi:hypothetical protein
MGQGYPVVLVHTAFENASIFQNLAHALSKTYLICRGLSEYPWPRKSNNTTWNVFESAWAKFWKIEAFSKGYPVVLVHTAFENASIFQNLAHALSKTFQVVLLEIISSANSLNLICRGLSEYPWPRKSNNTTWNVFETMGQGYPVVLVHTAFENASIFQNLAHALSKTFQVVLNFEKLKHFQTQYVQALLGILVP